jgi:hypothetical protein
MRRPNSTSTFCSSESFGPRLKSFPGMSGASHGVASINSTPSFFNSPAIAPKMVWAFFSLSRSRSAMVRKSGRKSKRFFGAIWPTMTHCVTPRSVKAAIILESWPTLSQTISSTSGASAGSVSFSNATATSFFTPARRACRANSSGSERLPAMRPRDAGAVFICEGRMKSEE